MEDNLGPSLDAVFYALGINIGLGYLLGSIPFGLVLCYLCGYGDIRKIGSGNIGATNVLRTGNKLLALITLILDASKGAIAVAIGMLVIGINDPEFIMLGAVLGHCFPIWLKFKGGKGVATTLGTLLAGLPWVGVLACVTWGVTAGIFRYSSLSALVAIALAPITAFIFYGAASAYVVAVIALLVFWRHRENIRRLLAGTEPKIGAKKQEPNKQNKDSHAADPAKE